MKYEGYVFYSRVRHIYALKCSKKQCKRQKDHKRKKATNWLDNILPRPIQLCAPFHCWKLTPMLMSNFRHREQSLRR